MNAETYPQESETEHTSKAIDLAELDSLRGNYTETKTEERQFDPVPDGKYQVNVDKVELTRSRVSEKPMLRWTLRILGPTCRNRLLWKNNMITAESMKWFKTDIHTAGLDLADITDLPARMVELQNVKLDIVKKTKGENENIYINRRIVMDDPMAGDDVPQDGVPF